MQFQKSPLFSAGRIFVAISLVLASHIAAAAEPSIYNFSPVNQYNLQVSARFWNPIVAYVSARSGVRLVLKLGRTSADTTSYVLAREVDFAFTNHLFSPERNKMGWKVFGRREGPALSGQIVVPANSPVKTLAELAGKQIAFPGSEAFIAYKVTSAQLIKQNIQASTLFAGNMDGAFSQLFSGKVQAVGANSQLVDGYEKRESRSFRVLWSSGPFNDLALMASPRVSDTEIRAVAKAFIGMSSDPEGKSILKKASELVNATVPVSFVQASDDDYLAYRNFYNTAPPALR
jgi:ABC-type phosphate/phosphonate transport system substrate-binding protein